MAGEPVSAEIVAAEFGCVMATAERLMGEDWPRYMREEPPPTQPEPVAICYRPRCPRCGARVRFPPPGLSHLPRPGPRQPCRMVPLREWRDCCKRDVLICEKCGACLLCRPHLQARCKAGEPFPTRRRSLSSD